MERYFLTERFRTRLLIILSHNGEKSKEESTINNKCSTPSTLNLTMEEETEGTVVPWSVVWVTAAVSFAQGLVCYLVFRCIKSKHQQSYDNDNQEALNLYEPRQHTKKHRSPSPFTSLWNDWKLSDEETLRCVGLDAFMYLRMLQLGMRICAFGSLLACALIPIYATGDNSGASTEQFNMLTLAKVEKGSSWRLYVTVGSFWLFCFFILKLFWNEWKLYYKNRMAFLANGDVDAKCRHAVFVEQFKNNNDKTVNKYFERLFPNQVCEVASCLQVPELEKLIKDRQQAIAKLEVTIAFTKAYPSKPRPTVRTGMFSSKVDAIEHHEAEIERLNTTIDKRRNEIGLETNKVDLELPMDPTASTEESNDDQGNVQTSSTALVTFTSLRSKQAALQCELTGDPDSVVVVPAPDPDAILWDNVTMPLNRQRVVQFACAMFWMVGILFWAVPVAFVTSIANLNSLLDSLGLDTVDENQAWYGLVSGLLPVVFLAILMAVLYMAINVVATKVVKLKSLPQVESYCVFWHMLFQFANLWLILIGGSLFNQLNTLIEEPGEFVDIIADALPGASTFFVNMILVDSFGSLGIELSQIPAFVVSRIMGFLQPEPARTQRQLDETKQPQPIVWGQQVPPTIFVFLVSFMYMPIVPLIEILAMVYFLFMYIVWYVHFDCLFILISYPCHFSCSGNTSACMSTLSQSKEEAKRLGNMCLGS